MEKEMEALLSHLGQDIGYMGLRVQKDVQKCLKDLKVTHDQKSFCDKITNILKRFSEFTVQYSKDLEGRIKDCNKEEEYRDITNRLKEISTQNITCHTCKKKSGAHTSNSLGPSNINADQELEKQEELEKDELKNEVLSQESFHIGVKDDTKSEPSTPNQLQASDTEDLPSNDLTDTKEPGFSQQERNDLPYNASNSSFVDNGITNDHGILEQKVENQSIEINEDDANFANSLEISHSEEIELSHMEEEEEEIMTYLPEKEDTPHILTSEQSKMNQFYNRSDISTVSEINNPVEPQQECAGSDANDVLQFAAGVIPLPYKSLTKIDNTAKKSAYLNTECTSVSGDKENPVSYIPEKEDTTNILTSEQSKTDQSNNCSDINAVAEITDPVELQQECAGSDANEVLVFASGVIPLPYKSLMEKDNTVKEPSYLNADCTSVSGDKENLGKPGEGSICPNADRTAEFISHDGNVPGEDIDSNVEIMENVFPTAIGSDRSVADPARIDESQCTDEIIDWHARMDTNCTLETLPRRHLSEETVVCLNNKPTSQDTEESTFDCETVKNFDVKLSDIAENAAESNEWDNETVANILEEQYSDLGTVNNSQPSPNNKAVTSEGGTDDDIPLANNDIIRRPKNNYSEETIANHSLTIEISENDSEETVIASPLDQALVSHEENDSNEATPKGTQDVKHNSDNDVIYSKATQKITSTAVSDDFIYNIETQDATSKNSGNDNSDFSKSDSDTMDAKTQDDKTVYNSGDAIGEKTVDTAGESTEAEEEQERATQDIEIFQTQTMLEGGDIVMENDEDDMASQESYIFNLDNNQDSQGIQENLPENDGTVAEAEERDRITESDETIDLEIREKVSGCDIATTLTTDGSVVSPNNKNEDGNGEDKLSGSQLSDSGSSSDIIETTKKKPKKKLKKKDRVSLLRVIADYFSRRKREKAKTLNKIINDKNKKAGKKTSKKVEQKRTPHKSKRNKKITNLPEDSVKTKRERKYSTGRKGERDAQEYLDFLASSRDNEDSSNSSVDSAGENGTIQEDQSGSSDIEATQIKGSDLAQSEKDQNALTNEEGNADSRIVSPFKKNTVRPLPGTDSDDENAESQKVSPFKKKPVRPPPGTESDDENTDSQIVIRFKRKVVMSLAATQSDDENADSQVFSSFKKKVVRPLVGTESDDESAESQTVSPFKKKVVRPLAGTESDDENADSQMVVRFKRKVVRPLPSTQLDGEDGMNKERLDSRESKDDNEVVSPFKKKGVKRLFPSDENDSANQVVRPSKRLCAKRFLSNENGDAEPVKQTSENKGSEIQRSVLAHLSLEHSNPEELVIDQNTEEEADDQYNTQEDEEMPEGNYIEPSQFKLDDKARDDFLNMFDEHSNSSTLDKDSDKEESEGDGGDNIESEDGNSNAEANQFRLGDCDRDNLLNLLTDKEQDERNDEEESPNMVNDSDNELEGSAASKKVTKDPPNMHSQFKLNSKERDELLDLLSDRPSNNSKGSDTNLNKEAKSDSSKTRSLDSSFESNQFKLNNADRDELLEMLSTGHGDGSRAEDDKRKPTEKDTDTHTAKTNLINTKNPQSNSVNEEVEPSLFKLNDEARDDFLDLLNDNHIDNSGDKNEGRQPSSEDGADHPEDTLKNDFGSKKKHESNDGNLKNAIDKNPNVGDEAMDVDKVGEEIDDDQADINDAATENSQGYDDIDESDFDEDETLKALDIEDEQDDETGKQNSAAKSSEFTLDEDEKAELLNLLSEFIKKKETGSDSDTSETDSDEARDTVKRNEKSKKNKRKLKEVDENMLMELLQEYEDVVTGKDKELAESITTGGMNIDKMEFETENADNDFCEDSVADPESMLLDLVREEVVEQPDEPKRKKTRNTSKAAWKAYRELLKDNEELSDTSSSDMSNIDIEDIELDFSDQERRQKDREVHDKLKKVFEIDQELFINIEQADISGFDLSFLPRRGGNVSSKIDRLCDISNVLQKRKRPERKKRKVKVARLSPTVRSDSSASGSDNDSSSSSSSSHFSNDSLYHNQDTASNRDSPYAHLWEDIKNSSDETNGWSSESDSVTSEDEKDKKKSKKIGGGRVKKEKKDKSDNELEDGTGSEANAEKSDNEDGEEDSDGNKDNKDGDVKGADLDSSDEDDFVGVRKSKGAWKHDPLLRSCLSSEDESDSNSDASQRKAHKIRLKRKQVDRGGLEADSSSEKDGTKTPIEDIGSSTDSDVEFVMAKEKTPNKSIVIDDEAEDDSPSKKGKGRRNIRALFEDDELAEATRKAKKEESERIKRLQEREKNKESFTQSQSMGSQLSEDDLDPLILDVNEEQQIKVHPKITKKLKPHQRSGIQFMWDSCYESVEQLKKGYEGSGCILAHCMGLGKTLQALGLIHTIFNYKDVTKTKHVLVVCPLSTVSNWRNEYRLAYKGIRNSNVQLYTIQDKKAAVNRFDIVKSWWKSGGLLIMGYECFGLLINDQKLEKWSQNGLCKKEDVLKALVNPGPDLVICDEGHLLRNKQTRRSIALNKVDTRRRIVLTGTPLQNNLLEYYCMVSFVKPNLLGTEKEYKTNFVNPISNGQFENSTAIDILFMKKRTHVLHKILNKTVQRVEDTELKQYLPELIDQALFVKLSDLQIQFYNTFLDVANARPVEYTAAGNISRNHFFGDIFMLRYICTHPDIVTIAKKCRKSKIREQDVIDDNMDEAIEDKVFAKDDWYKNLVPESGVRTPELGTKIITTLEIVKEAVANDDKVLIFSQSHAEMDSLEFFLKQQLNYKKTVNYNRMDGTISPEVRTHMCDSFNNKLNKKLRVFIMSTKVGGLGLNLTGANRVILMNVNWNPSYDTQSVFRAFRFGQTKPVYVYRLIAIDTMEEKMYQRNVTKLAVAHRVVDKHQITRHFSEADIQEFYSVRPTVEGERPVPNLPEDRVLAKLIQKFQFLYRWHEHQALLANRPEEDLNEQQKNAAWEEFNKKAIEPPLPSMPPPPPQFVNVSGMLSQPGPSGLQKQFVAPSYPSLPPRPTANGLFADHNYSLPKTNPIVAQRTDSADDFVSTQSKYMPRPVFVDVKAPLGPRPNLSGLNTSTGHKIRINTTNQPMQYQPPTKPGQNQAPTKPGQNHPPTKPGQNQPSTKPGQNQPTTKPVQTQTAPHQVRLGSAITITHNSSPKANPPPAHAQKPSISIIPQAASTRTNTNIMISKPPPFVPKGTNMVQNPLNLTVNPNQSARKDMWHQTYNQFKNIVGNGVIKSTQTANSPQINKGPHKPVTTLPPRTVVAPTLQLINTVASPPALIRPVITSTSSATSTSDPLNVATSTSSTTTSDQQSPLQKQMRNFMEHLHHLQQTMKSTEEEAVSNLGDSNRGRVYNPNGNNQGTATSINNTGRINTSNDPLVLNNQVSSQTRIIKVGPKPVSPVIGGLSTTNVTGLNAARNLTNISKTYQRKPNNILGAPLMASASTSQNSAYRPTVRVIGAHPTFPTVVPNNTGSPVLHPSSNRPKGIRKTITDSQGVPTSTVIWKGNGGLRNTVINTVGQTNNGNFSRVITKVVGQNPTGEDTRVNPVGLINGNVEGKATGGGNVITSIVPGAAGHKKILISQRGDTQQNSAPAQNLTSPIRFDILRKKIVANFNRFAPKQLPVHGPSKQLGPSPRKPPIQLPPAPQRSFNNGNEVKTYQVRKNHSPLRSSSSLPSLTQVAAVSKANKENRSKRRLSLRTNNNTISSSVDLSNAEDSGNNSSGSLSQDVVNTLKKKGVSVNYLGKDTINLD